MTGKLEETILAALEKNGAASPEAREGVYGRFRAAILQTAAERGQDQATVEGKLALFDRTVAEVESRLVEGRLASALDDELSSIGDAAESSASAPGVCPSEEPPRGSRGAGETSLDEKRAAYHSARRSRLAFAAAAIAVVAGILVASQFDWFGARPDAPMSIVGDQSMAMQEEMAGIAVKAIADADADAIAAQVGDAVSRFGPDATRTFLNSGYRTIGEPAVRPLHFQAAKAAYETYGADWAAYQLALDYLSGYGTRRYVDRAVELFEKLVQLGHGGAEYSMARLLLDETYHSPDRERAIGLLESAAAKGSARAAALLDEARAGG